MDSAAQALTASQPPSRGMVRRFAPEQCTRTRQRRALGTDVPKMELLCMAWNLRNSITISYTRA